jgi:hypothetical protein
LIHLPSNDKVVLCIAQRRMNKLSHSAGKSWTLRSEKVNGYLQAPIVLSPGKSTPVPIELDTWWTEETRGGLDPTGEQKNLWPC